MKQFIRKIMWRICGLQKLQDQIDSQYYFINNSIDITKFPKATGDLALLHEADYWWLMIFVKICEENGLVYWLEGGTLLGAIRHQGSIPWDDDLDVAMPISDCKKFKTIINQVLNPEYLNFSPSYSKGPEEWFGYGYKHKKTGVWLDIYPVYDCEEDDSKFFVTDGGYEFYISKSQLFPLLKRQYEHSQFCVPRDFDFYLRHEYGEYMDFPKSGILHHDYGRGPLAEWHKKYDISMLDIIEELRLIYENL